MHSKNAIRKKYKIMKLVENCIRLFEVKQSTSQNKSFCYFFGIKFSLLSALEVVAATL